MNNNRTLIRHWTGAERLTRFALVCLLALALTACASARQPVVPGPKVQTFHELMVKLKKGFDEGTLDTPEFYAQELGYPLDRPEQLKVLAAPYAPARQIRFDSGELMGTVAEVGPLAHADGRKSVSFRGSNVVRRKPGQPCVSLTDVQLFWGVVDPKPQVWGAHGPLPIRHYTYRTITDGKERVAMFDVSTSTGCIGAGFSVGQYYE